MLVNGYEELNKLLVNYINSKMNIKIERSKFKERKYETDKASYSL